MSLHRRENRYRFRGGNVRMRPLQEAHSIRVTKNRAPEPIQQLTNCSLGGSLQGDPTIGLCGERTISVEYGKEATVLVEKVACRRLRRVGTGRKCRKCFLWEGIDSGAKFGHKYTGNMKQEIITTAAIILRETPSAQRHTSTCGSTSWCIEAVPTNSKQPAHCPPSLSQAVGPFPTTRRVKQLPGCGT